MTEAAPAELRVRPEALGTFLSGVLEAMGADPEVAEETADHLVGANLAGHDSHGVMRIGQYVDAQDRGRLRPEARGTVAREGPSLLLFDAESGLGQWSTRRALEWCLDRAEGSGIAAAAVRHSTHIGRLGHYAEVAARRGLVSIVTTGVVGPGVGAVAPFGGTGRLLSTNPWAFGVPAEGGDRFLADFATTQVAEGKVRVARYRGKPVAEGILLDREGNPTTEPAGFYDGGTILPLGGALTGHKGYGLGMAAALLGGLAAIDHAESRPAGTMLAPDETDEWLGGVFLIAIDPGWFGDADAFRREVGGILASARGMPPAPGVDRVRVPGDPEAHEREERARAGLLIPASLWDELGTISERFGVPLPATH